jgi:hypothetical protein
MLPLTVKPMKKPGMRSIENKRWTAATTAIEESTGNSIIIRVEIAKTQPIAKL